MAYRKGPWKAHFLTQPGYGGKTAESHEPPLLFHLEHDPSETTNVAEKHADVIKSIQEDVMEHRSRLKPAKSQLEIPLAKP